MTAFFRKLRWWVRRRSKEANLREELEFHLTEEEALQRAKGNQDPESAARRDLGNFALVQEDTRAEWTWLFMERLLQDIRYALRTLRKSSGFALASIAVLVLAIGANAAIFSVVNAVLRPLPYRSAEQLMMLWSGTPGQSAQGRLAYQTVEDWHRQSQSFADMAVMDPASVMLANADGVERISASRISPNFFQLLGVEPVAGRSFSAQEAEQRRRFVLISYSFWQRQFAGSHDAIGTSLELDGHPSQIIGILPADLEFRADVWEPHTLVPDWESRRGVRGVGSWFVIGRLRPGVTVDHAQREMSAIARVLDNEVSPAERAGGVRIVPLSESIVGTKLRLSLWMLTAAVFCVLVIAVANVASLALARSISRAREIAVRTALGASSLRIVQQLVAESVTIAVISGILGMLLARAGVRLIRTFGPADVPHLADVTLDLRALGLTFVVSCLTGVVVGLLSAATTLRRNRRLSGENSRTRTSGGIAINRVRRALIVAQFALALTLMAGAGLLIQSWRYVVGVDPGFAPERVLSIQLSTAAFEGARRRVNFYTSVLEHVQSLPGIESAGIIGDLFVSSDAERIVTIEGTNGVSSERLRMRVDEASERLFTTVRTPLLRGRFFSAEDSPGSPPVAIINHAMAERLWHGSDPVGRRFKVGDPQSDRPWFTVVGVVGDMRRQGPEVQPIPQMFESLAQNPSRLATLLVRTFTEEPLKMRSAVQAAVRRVDKTAPLYGVTTLESRMGAYLVQRRFQTGLVIGFSIIALLMAAIGIYGLLHYSVATRAHEIGIRMAVGAKSGDIFRVTVREGLQLCVTGLVLGLIGALLVGRIGSSFLFGVTATDPLTLTSVSLLLTAVAAIASYFPARRAMKTDPMVVLRQD